MGELVADALRLTGKPWAAQHVLVLQVLAMIRHGGSLLA